MKVWRKQWEVLYGNLSPRLSPSPRTSEKVAKLLDRERYQVIYGANYGLIIVSDSQPTPVTGILILVSVRSNRASILPSAECIMSFLPGLPFHPPFRYNCWRLRSAGRCGQSGSAQLVGQPSSLHRPSRETCHGADLSL